jgi:hypothetical protein
MMIRKPWGLKMDDDLAIVVLALIVQPWIDDEAYGLMIEPDGRFMVVSLAWDDTPQYVWDGTGWSPL